MAVVIEDITGTVTDGSTITITGSGFGTHALGIEWLGGATGNIESGTNTNAFVRTGWTTSLDAWGDGTTERTPRYSTTQHHSGTKSIKSSYTTTAYNSGYAFDTGGTQTSLYFSYWTYFDWEAAFDGQWKTWRLMDTDSYNDGQTHAYNSQQYQTGDGDGEMSANYGMGYWNGSTPTEIFSLPIGITRNQWSRIEAYYIPETGGLANGVLQYYIHNQTAAVLERSNVSDLTSDPAGLRYFTIQNYLGNLISGSRDTCAVYVDDVYVQVGTQARVEICDSATWVARTHSEIQPPSAWADGETTVAANRGSFGPTDTVYLYVIDSAGAVNSEGYAITFADGVSTSASGGQFMQLNELL